MTLHSFESILVCVLPFDSLSIAPSLGKSNQTIMWMWIWAFCFTQWINSEQRIGIAAFNWSHLDLPSIVLFGNRNRLQKTAISNSNNKIQKEKIKVQATQWISCSQSVHFASHHIVISIHQRTGTVIRLVYVRRVNPFLGFANSLLTVNLMG